MNWKRQESNAQLKLLTIGVVLGLLVMGLVSYKAFGLNELDGARNIIQNTPDYQSILLVNALIGASVLLLVLELRGDAVRVLLTVWVALIFGYIMTMLFNLDEAEKFIRGDFQVRVISAAESPVSLSYEQDLTATFNDPVNDTPLTEALYSFMGSTGDEVTILAYATDPEAGLDMQVALLDADGATLETSSEASRRFTQQYSDYITSENDAVIKDFALPADGIYTILAQPEADLPADPTEFGVALLSDNEATIDLLYNGSPVGNIFNKENVDEPLTTARYSFVGGADDEVTLLAYVKRANIAADLQIALLDADGNVLESNQDASSDQVAAYKDLKRSSDAILENITLPATGTYWVQVQPETITTGTKLSETFSATNKAYNAFLLGPLSRLNRWVIWMRDALTLIILGLAIAIVFRAEQFSLGAEGQLYLGALVSGAITLSLGNDVAKTLLVPIALLSAATVGFLWGLLPGALKAYLGANELVSTLMLNVIAQRFYEMVLTFELKPPDAGYTASDWIPKNGLLAPIIDVDGDQVSIAVYILIALVLLTWVLIQRTPFGYEIRMIGANIKFADYGGVNSRRTIMLVMAISGAVAGLAGAHLSMGIHRKLILNISIGLAFEGVVVALLARNNPLVVPFTGLLYAYLRTGAKVMESDANISAEVVRIIQAVVILLITAEALVTFFQHRRTRQQATDGPAPEPGGNPDQENIITPAKEGAHG